MSESMNSEEVPLTEVVERIRTDLTSHVGSKMKLKANLGRCKIVEKEGILEEAHPNVFVIRVEEKMSRERRISYTYADVLTKTVELSHPQSGENLLPWLH